MQVGGQVGERGESRGEGSYQLQLTHTKMKFCKIQSNHHTNNRSLTPKSMPVKPNATIHLYPSTNQPTNQPPTYHPPTHPPTTHPSDRPPTHTPHTHPPIQLTDQPTNQPSHTLTHPLWSSTPRPSHTKSQSTNQPTNLHRMKPAPPPARAPTHPPTKQTNNPPYHTTLPHPPPPTHPPWCSTAAESYALAAPSSLSKKPRCTPFWPGGLIDAFHLPLPAIQLTPRNMLDPQHLQAGRQAADAREHAGPPAPAGSAPPLP